MGKHKVLSAVLQVLSYASDAKGIWNLFWSGEVKAILDVSVFGWIVAGIVMAVLAFAIRDVLAHLYRDEIDRKRALIRKGRKIAAYVKAYTSKPLSADDLETDPDFLELKLYLEPYDEQKYPKSTQGVYLWLVDGLEKKEKMWGVGVELPRQSKKSLIVGIVVPVVVLLCILLYLQYGNSSNASAVKEGSNVTDSLGVLPEQALIPEIPEEFRDCRWFRVLFTAVVIHSFGDQVYPDSVAVQFTYYAAGWGASQEYATLFLDTTGTYSVRVPLEFRATDLDCRIDVRMLELGSKAETDWPVIVERFASKNEFRIGPLTKESRIVDSTLWEVHFMFECIE